MNLYWVVTKDHDEDCFIVARNRMQAERFHEGNEGYDPGDAMATLVIRIPKHIEIENGWPSEENLISLGAIIVGSVEGQRIVAVKGQLYCYGMCELLKVIQ